MARTVGSKNKNDTGAEFTKLLRTYWGKPDKVALINEKLEEVIVDGGHRDALSAIGTVLKYVAIPMEKEIDADIAVTTADKSRTEILEEIRKLKA